MHVSPDSGSAHSVGRVTRERNAAAVRQGLESVIGGVLIYAHGSFTARLNLGECAVGVTGEGGTPGIRGGLFDAGQCHHNED